jgi:hypothetical protein
MKTPDDLSDETVHAVRETGPGQEHEWAFTEYNVDAVLAAEVYSGLAYGTHPTCTTRAVHPKVSDPCGDTIANNRFGRRW